jgi:hypothetical protein
VDYNDGDQRLYLAGGVPTFGICRMFHVVLELGHNIPLAWIVIIELEQYMMHGFCRIYGS